jgi:hypothetical protein
MPPLIEDLLDDFVVEDLGEVLLDESISLG